MRARITSKIQFVKCQTSSIDIISLNHLNIAINFCQAISFEFLSRLLFLGGFCPIEHSIIFTNDFTGLRGNDGHLIEQGLRRRVTLDRRLQGNKFRRIFPVAVQINRKMTS